MESISFSLLISLSYNLYESNGSVFKPKGISFLLGYFSFADLLFSLLLCFVFVVVFCLLFLLYSFASVIVFCLWTGITGWRRGNHAPSMFALFEPVHTHSMNSINWFQININRLEQVLKAAALYGALQWGGMPGMPSLTSREHLKLMWHSHCMALWNMHYFTFPYYQSWDSLAASWASLVVRQLRKHFRSLSTAGLIKVRIVTTGLVFLTSG